MPAARGCLLAAACALLLMPHATGAAPTVGEGASEADEFFNNDGMPLMMPVNRTTDRRRWYFEVPRDPGGCCLRRTFRQHLFRTAAFAAAFAGTSHAAAPRFAVTRTHASFFSCFSSLLQSAYW